MKAIVKRRLRFFGMGLILLTLALSLGGCGALPENPFQTGSGEKKEDAGQTEQPVQIAKETKAEAESETQIMTEKQTEAQTEAQTETQPGQQTQTEAASSAQPESAAHTEEQQTETETEFQNPYAVCIDPGHQGSWVDMSAQEPNGPGSSVMKMKATTGTQGYYTGVPEYQLNLTIGLALRDELKLRGYRVVMTREDNDTAISNMERALKAGDMGCDAAVRIHANGSDDHSVQGALAMIGSAQNPWIGGLYEENARLAQCIMDAYCAQTGFVNLGTGLYDDMTGLNWCQIPAMILEMGFMSNEHDDLMMQDPAVQRQMVKGIADGLDAYFRLDELRAMSGTGTAAQNAAKGEKESETETAAGGKTGTETETETETQEDAIPEGIIRTLYDTYLAGRESMGERWAISLEKLGTKEITQYRANEVFQSASVIKVFIMGAVYDRICYPADESKTIYFAESYDGELRYLLEQMIRVSDNEAANRLITILGGGDFQAGAQVVNAFCKEHGYKATSVGRRFLESNPTGDNYTSAADCRAILSEICRGTLVCEEASAKMLDILKGQTVRHKIPAGLPEGFTSANKTGEMPEGYGLGCIENDIAIVFSPYGDYVLTVLSNDLGGRNYEAQSIIVQISSTVAAWMQEQAG